MGDTKLRKELDEIDKISVIIQEIIEKLHKKIKDENLDEETIAFLIYIAECLEAKRIDLKDVNIDLIKNFMPLSVERSKLLFQNMTEKDRMQREQKNHQLEDVKYLSSIEDVNNPLLIRH